MSDDYSYESDDSPTNPDIHEALGQSDAFLDFQERVSRAAPVNRPVLLVGERGTGKELAASRLHYLSKRWDGPFSLYWPNGKLSEYGIYRQGKWYGAYSSYFSSGPLEIRTQYIDDQIHGPFSEFYESGQRKVSGAYDNGFKHGRWTHYAESGLVVLREQYEHGQLIEAEHTQITTYADGTLKSTAPLTDGAIDGHQSTSASSNSASQGVSVTQSPMY